MNLRCQIIYEERQLTIFRDYLIHFHGFNYYLYVKDSRICLQLYALDHTPNISNKSHSFLSPTSYIYLKYNNLSLFLSNLLVQPLFWPHFNPLSTNISYFHKHPILLAFSAPYFVIHPHPYVSESSPGFLSVNKWKNKLYLG